MQQAPIPRDEYARQAAVDNLHVLDTPPEERFDSITRIATSVFNVPISTLTIIDHEREWFKSCQGLNETEGERAISFCGHALIEPRALVVLDTTKDVRFADNPLVTGPPYLRFYAGIPLFSASGERVGVLCIKDTAAHHTFTTDDEVALRCLAHWAEQELNHRTIMTDLTRCSGRTLDDIGGIADAHTKKLEEIRTFMKDPATHLRDAAEALNEQKAAHLDAIVRDIRVNIAQKC